MERMSHRGSFLILHVEVQICFSRNCLHIHVTFTYSRKQKKAKKVKKDEDPDP